MALPSSLIGRNQILCVNSADRVYGTPTNFAVNVASYNLRPTYCSYHSIALPNGFYNIPNNVSLTVAARWNGGGNTATLTVNAAAGYWNITTLMQFIVNTLNAQLTPVGSFGNSYSSTTGLVTLIAPTLYNGFNDFAFHLVAGGGLDTVLGFTAAQATNTFISQITGLNFVDLRGAVNIYVRCSLVSGQYLTTSKNAGTQSVLAVVQNLALFGQTIFQKIDNPQMDIFPVCSHGISQICFQLVDEYGTELVMNTGQDWTISLFLASI